MYTIALPVGKQDIYQSNAQKKFPYTRIYQTCTGDILPNIVFILQTERVFRDDQIQMQLPSAS